MNKEDYGTLEACQRLRDAKILYRLPVIYDRVYSKDFEKEGFITSPVLTSSAPGCYQVSFDDGKVGFFNPEDLVILYSMTEVWRELLNDYQGSTLTLIKGNGGLSIVGYERNKSWVCYVKDTNPADALIDLLIWLIAKEKQT